MINVQANQRNLVHNVTATTGGTHASDSYHVKPGTGNLGRAVDFGWRSNRDAELFAIQAYFWINHRNHLAQLIGPNHSQLIGGGKIVLPGYYGDSILADHQNHVHAATELGTFLPKGLPYPGVLIRQGSTGQNVRGVQSRVGASVDGSFGPNTKQHVVDYQKSRRLTADGIVGPATWANLFG